jgi:hypothetical protein
MVAKWHGQVSIRMVLPKAPTPSRLISINSQR